MAEITWSPGLSVGVTEFDREHQRLIGTINELRRAMSRGEGRHVVRSVLESLVEYARTHFAHEEQLLREHGYPGLAAHKKEHDDITQKVAALREDFYRGNVSIALEIHDLLTGWLEHHIQETDKAYAQFLNQRGIA
jgi:hemerythrin-like metal-binding protein